MGIFNTFMADTVGVIYRAGTGNVDPWTKQELTDNAAAALEQAGATPADATAQAQQDVTDTLSGFSLGGGDQLGADPSQTTGLNLPSLQSLKDGMQSLTEDNGTGCGITNLGGCIQVPSWVWWVGGAAAVLVVLQILGPYVGLIPRRS